jgi:RNAse (barnase) inhibitor barstar
MKEFRYINEWADIIQA